MVLGIFCATAMLCGCASPQKPAPNTPAKPAPEKTVVTPNLVPSGYVAMVNSAARFVVLNYPPGGVPKPGQHLGVYRNNLKVGEVQVNDYQSDSIYRSGDNVSADILVGDVQAKDQTRPE
jgi:hypothetical protein